MQTSNRRPIETRSQAWAHMLAGRLAKSGLSPNQISLLGIGVSLVGALSLLTVSSLGNAFFSGLLLIVAAITVQLRLLCNMLDGLVAVEYGKKSKLGDLFNEVPDRIEDVLFIVAAGYAAGTSTGVFFGWAAALLSVGTAYVRLLGGSLGFKQNFCGPLAKPQRMFLLTVTLMATTFQVWISGGKSFLTFGLLLILIGTFATLVRRLFILANVMSRR